MANIILPSIHNCLTILKYDWQENKGFHLDITIATCLRWEKRLKESIGITVDNMESSGVIITLVPSDFRSPKTKTATREFLTDGKC